MRSGDPRAGLSHARPGPTDPPALRYREQEWEARGRQEEGQCGREEASACRARKPFPWQRGGSQLIRGMSSQQGLPRPESWGSPRSFGPGARSFGSGRKGLTAVPLRVSPALQSLSFRSTTPPPPPAALQRLPPRAHVRLQLPHPRLVLARTTASGSTHAANSFVSHVTNDARAPAMRGGVLPEESHRQRQWCACRFLH